MHDSLTRGQRNRTGDNEPRKRRLKSNEAGWKNKMKCGQQRIQEEALMNMLLSFFRMTQACR